MKNARRIVFFTLLVVAAVAGNYVTVPLFFGFDFLFSGIAVLLILYLYGTLSLSKDVLVQQASELNHLSESLREEMVERKQAENSLRKSEQQVRLQATALGSAANAILITDHNGVIEWVNPAFTKLTDYTFDEAVGKNPRLLKSGKHDEIFYQNLWTTILSGRVWHEEVINRRKDGSLYTEEQTIAPVVAGDGRITHFVSIKQDVSERKLTETKLRQNMDELERANRVKNEFLGVISHELRTPLNVIMGYSQMFKEGAFGAVNLEQSRALDKITLQSAELLRMVNSILAVTKIEADEVSAESDAIDLETFLDGLKDEYNTPVTHGVPIAWDCQPGLPTLISDANKLKHIMQNLVNNALKFTDEGYIRVSVKRLPGEEKIALMVTDTGIGIAKKDLPNIFDKFHQANSSLNRNYIGAGLGLYIVKKYADLLGGEVAVDSVPGKGSTFTITLPLRNVEKATCSTGNTSLA